MWSQTSSSARPPAATVRATSRRASSSNTSREPTCTSSGASPESSPWIGETSGLRRSPGLADVVAREHRKAERLQHRIEVHVRPHGLTRGLEVDPRRQAHRDRGLRQAALAQRQQGRHGQPAARRVAADRHLRGRQTLREQPLVGRDGVVEPGRERVLRGESVVDREHPHARRAAQLAGQAAVRRARAADVAAAVQVQQRAVVADARRLDPLAVYVADPQLGPAHVAGRSQALTRHLEGPADPPVAAAHRLAAQGRQPHHADQQAVLPALPRRLAHVVPVP